MAPNNVILGVGGGIAAYKSAELARTLVQRDIRVQVVMTSGAQEFVRPLTFATLTGRKVITGMFSSSGSAEETLSSAVEHIGVAQENDLLVVELPKKSKQPLIDICAALLAAEINIHYAYPLLLRPRAPSLALYVDDSTLAARLLIKKGFTLIGESDLE